MGPWEWFVLFAVCGLIVAAATYWNRSNDSRAYRDAWQESTTAERTEADVRRDLAAAEAARDRMNDLAECLAIWDATQHDIPHQTRRTEEDQ